MKEKGFTLIEILLAVFILGIVLTTVYASYTGTFRIIADTTADAELYGMARTSLQRMTQDIEAVSPWQKSFEFVAKPYVLQDTDFTGLTFRSRAHVAFGKNEPPAGIAIIEYTVEETDEHGVFALYRSDSLSLDPEREEAPSRKYLLCDKIANLTCRFYDERGREYETWDSNGSEERQKKKAPTLVEIRLSLVNGKNPDNPYVFMTSVRPPLAGAL